MPFIKPQIYTYDKLSEDFIFKYAILQDDELVGVLYLEIPYRYKCTKRFKIDDWFVVKPFDKTELNQERTYMAHVVIRYNANCKLNQDILKNIENTEPHKFQNPNHEFKTRIRHIGKTLYDHEKEGFQHLEEVEKKIRARRMRGLRNSGSVEKSLGKENRRDHSYGILSHTLTKKKAHDLNTSPNVRVKHFNLNDSVTPDELYRGVSRDKSRGKAEVDADKMVNRMAKEMVGLREEVTSLRGKLKAMEEGQMTVDNAKLSKQLDDEKEQVNRERGGLLKDFSGKSEKLEEDRKKLVNDAKKKEEEAQRTKLEYEEALKKLETDRIDADERLRTNLKRQEELDGQDKILQAKLRKLKEEEANLNKEREDLADYSIELETLKDNLMRERETVIRDKARLTVEKENLEAEIKALKLQKAEIEKQKEKELKELAKRKNDLDLKEDRITKREEELPIKKAELEKKIAELDLLKKDLTKAKEEAEEQQLALWRDRNKLNQEVKEFIEDKKMMQNDLKWQKEEVDAMYKELDEEREGLDKEREGLNDFEQELENMKIDLETRETQLLHEQDAFYNMKKAFLDKIVDSGQYEHMTPEMKKMAKDMGIDVEEMMDEAKRLKDRKDQLDKLKKENDNQLQKIKAMSSKNTSRRNSRRQSLLKPGGMGFHNELTNMYTRKMAVQEYLSSMYDNACAQHLIKDIAEKRREAQKAKDDLVFANKIIENIRNENKALKRDIDMITKIVDGMKGENFDLQSALGKNLKDVEIQTDLLTFGADGGIPNEVYDEMVKRVKDLETKLNRKKLQEKVSGGGDDELDVDNLDENLKE